MNPESKSTASPLFILLFLICFVGFSVPAAKAQQASDQDLSTQTRPRRVEAPLEVENPVTTSDVESAGTIVIAYAAYGEPLSLEPVRQRRLFSFSEYASPISNLTATRSRVASPNPSPAVSTAPMTVGEKFQFWLNSGLLSPGAYIGAIPKGMWNELLDNDDFKKDTFGNFMADSMTRAARSFAGTVTNGFYEKALLASIFKQDPRYHRSSKSGAAGKILYAATRVFVTQGDRCGCDQFNASFLLGGALGAVTANVWERQERTGPIHTTRRWANHILFTAGSNIIKEFLSGQ